LAFRRLHAQTVGACQFEIGGHRFDLTPLSNQYGSTDFVTALTSDSGGTVQLNICKNAQEPDTCTKENEQAAPGYALFNSDDPNAATCFRLGNMAKTVTSLIDAADPSKGIKLSYQTTDEGLVPYLNYELQCDTAADIGAPVVKDCDILYYGKDCNLVWKTSHACPGMASGGGGAKWATPFLVLFFLGVAAYIAIGMYVNYRRGIPIGIEAVPHLNFWRELPGLVTDGCRFSVHRGNAIMHRVFGERYQTFQSAVLRHAPAGVFGESAPASKVPEPSGKKGGGTFKVDAPASSYVPQASYQSEA